MTTFSPQSEWFTPKTESEWDQIKPTFTELYMDANLPLAKVMEIMEQRHRVKASTKMYKNKVKEWGLSKYLKAEQAQQIVRNALIEGDSNGQASNSGGHDDTLKRAQKSLKRKRAREKAQTQVSSFRPASRQIPPLASSFCEEPESYTPRESLVSPISVEVHNLNLAAAWNAPDPALGGVQPTLSPLSKAAQQFLINLRKWTHDAFMSGQWDSKSTARHHSGRKASRTWASDLTAGTNLYKKGRGALAWKYWALAVASFRNPDLLNSWYYETPIRLLFEMSRLVHDGHSLFAHRLLRYVKEWAENYLDYNDSRRALYSVFGELHPNELHGLYGHAAKSLYRGFASRIDKRNPLLYEIRLNRALDLLWYDPNADLSEWVPPIEEVDESCGPNNPYSVYFLLLEAYRLVAQECYEKVETVCQQVVKRLEDMKDESTVDPWRVGLAYRRLGRVQQGKKRYQDAMVNFNKALRYLSGGENRNSSSIQVEICQDLEQISTELNDLTEAALWRQKLKELEKQVAEQEEEEKKRLESVGDVPPFELNNGADWNGTEAMQEFTSFMLPLDFGEEGDAKRVRLDNADSRSASPGSPIAEGHGLLHINSIPTSVPPQTL